MVHVHVLEKGWTENLWKNVVNFVAKLFTIVGNIPHFKGRKLCIGKKLVWIKFILSTVNVTNIVSRYCWDDLLLRYRMGMPNILVVYGWCGAKFSLGRALDCKRGGLIYTQNNELRCGVSDLYRVVFSTLSVCGDPLIHTGWGVQEYNSFPHNGSCVNLNTVQGGSNIPLAGVGSEGGGDFMIQDFWLSVMDSFHDMYVVNTDAPS